MRCGNDNNNNDNNMREGLKPNSAVHTMLIKEVAEKLKIDESIVEKVIDFQFKFLRNCIKGGAEVSLDKLGSFRLIPDNGDGKFAKYVKSNGGYPDCLKIDDNDNEIIHNPDLFPNKAADFKRDYSPVKRKTRKLLFKGAISAKKHVYPEDHNGIDSDEVE